MKRFIHSDGNMTTAPPQVYYMELINENPDRDEIMCLVAEKLLEKFDITEQNGWVMQVWDGKTYQHLMNIKHQYGVALQKLIIFTRTLAYTKEFPTSINTTMPA